MSLPAKLAEALTKLSMLMAAVPKRSADMKSFLDSKKDSLKEIDGKFFAPTGFEDLSLEKLGKIIDEKVPGFLDENKDIFSGDPKTVIQPELEDANYTQAEIKKVQEEWVQECHLELERLANPESSEEKVTDDEIDEILDERCREDALLPLPLIPYSRQEVIDSICEDDASPDDIAQKEVVKDGNPDLNIALADDKPQNENLGVGDLDDLVDAIGEPNINIVIANVSGTILSVSAKVGDTVNCLTPMIETSKGTVLAGVKTGVVKKVNVSAGDEMRGVELFEIHTPEGDGAVRKGVVEIKRQVIAVNRYIDLKEIVSFKEKDWYFAEIENAFYENRYAAYAQYYNDFTPKVTERNRLNNVLKGYINTLSDIEDEINDEFGGTGLANLYGSNATNDGAGTSYRAYTSAERTAITDNLASLRDTRDDLISSINETIVDISSLTGEIDNIRSGNNYFAQTSTNVIAEITAGGGIDLGVDIRVDSSGNEDADGIYIKNSLTEKTVVAAFQPESSAVDVDDAFVLAKNLQMQSKTFTNELGLSKLTFDKITNLNLSTYNPKFERLDIDTNVSGPEERRWTLYKVKGNHSSNQRIDGSYIKIRIDFFNYIMGATDEDKGNPAWNEVTKIKENTLPDVTDAALDDTISKMAYPAKQYGHVAINQDEVFLNPKGTSTLESFKYAAASSRDLADTAKKVVLDIRDEMALIQQDLDQLPTIIEDIVSSECTIYEGCSTKNTPEGPARLCPWYKPYQPADPNAIEKQPVEEDINWNGFPRDAEESPPITDLKWWKKFCTLASLVNLIPTYWPVGLLIPTPATLVKIPLPVVWIPLVVIPTPISLIVIGIAQAGILPCPFVFILNPTDIPLGPISAGSCWLAGAIRPLKKIKDNPGDAIMPVAPILNIGGNQIDMAPAITALIPLIKDDFPPWERLSITNVLLLLFLMKWCAAGKKGEGFFENP
jgi:hypothetical protein